MAADSEVNGASHVNKAFIALETQIHSALLQQFPHSACLFVVFMQLSTSVRNKHVPQVQNH